jgi:hypothetical protein
VAKSVLDMVKATGRLGLARQAVKDARREGYISVAEEKRLTRQLNQHPHGGASVRSAKKQATASVQSG